MERIKIKNGIYLNAVKTDKFKTELFALSFASPLSAETASLNSLMESVLTRGSANYPTMRDISLKLDDLYASRLDSFTQRKGEVQLISFCSFMLGEAYTDKNVFEENLRLLNDVVFNPYLENGSFSASYFEREKKLLIDGIKEKKNNKTRYALNRCLELMCEGEAFEVQSDGSVEAAEAITLEKLYNHYCYAVENYPIELFYVGSLSSGEVIENIEKNITGLKPRNASLPETAVIKKAVPKPDYTEPMPVSQGKLSIGMRTGISLKDKDYPAFALFNELFGGSPTSLLFMNVREKLSLCYYCSSVPEALKGVIVVASGIENSNLEKAKKAILEQLEAAKSGNFTDLELEYAKKSLINAYKELPDSAFSLLGWYQGRVLAGLSSTPEEAAAAVAALTKEDVIRAANRVEVELVYFLEAELDKQN